MSIIKAVISGIIGAVVLTVIHQVARRRVTEAPRMDILGMRALARLLRLFGQKPPTGQRLYRSALIGDLLTNTVFYSLVGLGKPESALARGAGLGLAAGLGGIVLPEPLGLGKAPSARTPQTQAMTIGWYLIGGLVAALVYRAIGALPVRAEQ